MDFSLDHYIDLKWSDYVIYTSNLYEMSENKT